MKKYAMRIAERELDTEEAWRILDAGEYCVISTVDEDGTPYGVPMSYVMMDKKLYVHTTNTYGHKLDNWHHDPRVSVTVATEVEPCFEDTFFTSRFASVIASGQIHRVEDIVQVRQALVALCMKYMPELKHEIGPAIEREINDTDIWEVAFDEVRAKGGRRLSK
ncbi:MULTISPECIES: pyridoxamine 5'-phosphate oxidase family protein [unclassified Adlercreutzia]|uniref:pyridoxamine 5'-phosphate oxidase family protein n=1 Tax=unclassified Adlercreutzia TaxID=2636013 RepID=UPI0013EB18E0|nr:MULTISPECIES: pyridoxamine 5'-phosphate oxidase family protein [unclassified Adlercreutzia]